MVIKSFRESFETEEGQAIIIGALMMFILAFGLLVTLNLGIAVQEKIRLQNTSDAAAYSLAVTEAQAFNYIAFTNRVQAAHYNMIMTVQSYQSILLMIESILGTFADMIWAIYGLLFWIPYVGTIFQVIATIVGVIIGVLRFYLYGTWGGGEPKSYGAMPFMGYAKQAVWYINYAHYIATLIVAGAVWFKIINNMRPFIQKNDSRVDPTNNTISYIVNAVLNGYEYFQSFDRYAGGVPPFPTVTPGFDDDIESNKRDDNGDYENPYKRSEKAMRRQKIMGEISNASRSNNFNTDRYNSVDHGIMIININLKTIGAAKLIGVSPRILDNANKGNESFYNMDNLISSNPSNFENGIIRDIRKDGERRSAGSTGDIVASDQGLSITFSFGFNFVVIPIGFEKTWAQGVYMWSDNNGGSYWRWRIPDKNKTGICLFNNDKCMGRQRSSVVTPTKLYIRIPISFEDLLGPGIMTFVAQVRKGLFSGYWHGCKYTKTVSGAKEWWKENQASSAFGPKVRTVNAGNCRNKGPCSRWRRWGCCGKSPLDRLACKFEIAAKKKFQTHEYVSHEKNAQQYYFGISPYVKFLPKSERMKDFNQPSTWMLLNLPASNFLEGNPWNLKHDNDVLGTKGNSATHGGDGDWSQQKVDNNAKDGNTTESTGYVATQSTFATDPMMPGGDKFSSSKVLNFLPAGINVMSRARAYYHRPGNWNEHPNFFNPYWRAQLAPIAPKLTSIIGSTLGLDSEVASKGGIFGSLSNLGSTLLGVFSDAVARIITH